MPILRFPDLSKPQIPIGKSKVKIISAYIRRADSGKPLLYITFKSQKTDRCITQTWPVNEYRKSLIFQNLKVILQNEELEEINTDDLVGVECRIEITQNSKGYPEVEAIPMKTSTEEKAQ